MRLRFAKYEGLGNDFLVVDLKPGALTTAQVVALCDRHRGVGGDGVLFCGEDAPAMRVVNADGSIPEMCGNGIRCVALHLVRTGKAPGAAFDMATDAGPHHCRVSGDGDTRQVEVAMAPASLEPTTLPIVADGPVVDVPFQVGDRTLHVTGVSMGNPHAVVFDPVGDARLKLGPILQDDDRFPDGVNVGFVRLGDGPSAGLDLDVLERGAGWTQACGTGACAAAVAAVETGRAPRGEALEVRLPGGPMTIVAGEPGTPVMMTGPARHVFDGEIEV